MVQGSNEVLSSSLGQQVDSRSGQVIFHSHLPYGQEIRQVICQLNYQKSKLRLGASKILELLVLRYPGARGFFLVGGDRRSRDDESRSGEKKTSGTNG